MTTARSSARTPTRWPLPTLDRGGVDPGAATDGGADRGEDERVADAALEDLVHEGVVGVTLSAARSRWPRTTAEQGLGVVLRSPPRTWVRSRAAASRSSLRSMSRVSTGANSAAAASSNASGWAAGSAAVSAKGPSMGIRVP